MELMLGNRLMALPGPIMVTGHTGFKGTWLTFLLERLGVPVVGLSLEPEANSLFDRTNRKGVIPEAFADIRDIEKINQFMLRYKPSAVVHMAAQPLVLESYKEPRETFETNVLGTVNILDAALKNKSIEAVVIVTTDKVYKNDNSGHAFVETDPLEGKDPYSASKVATESVVAAWQQITKVSGGPKVISVRAGNVIGGGDWAENRLMPDLIRGLASGGPLRIRNPYSTRPWQHVLDPLHGYLLALEEILSGHDLRTLKFGPLGKSLSVKEVVAIVSATWQSAIEITFDPTLIGTPAEATNLHLDSSEASRILGWKPIWSQESAIIATIRWWENSLSGDSKQCVTSINFDIDTLLGNLKPTD
jgi:CDP-glucose 4,6-dehydratase